MQKTEHNSINVEKVDSGEYLQDGEPLQIDASGPFYTAESGDTESVHDALSSANEDGGTVYVPPGTYEMEGEDEWFVIREDVTFWAADGAQFVRTDPDLKAMIVNGSPDDAPGGYDGESNVTVKGGEWVGNYDEFGTTVTVIAMGHAENVTVKDVEVRDVGCGWHNVEFNAIRNGKLIDSFLHEYYDGASEDINGSDELFEIDRSSSGGFPFFDGGFDDTHCEDIEVRGCRFENTDGIGVGTHSTTDGEVYENITIENCEFYDIGGYAIRGLKWIDVTVRNCKFKDFWRNTFNANTDHDDRIENIVIDGCTFRSGERALRVGNFNDDEQFTHDACVTDCSAYDMENNAFGFDHVKDCSIKGCHVENGAQAGVWFYGDTENATAVGCTFENTATDDESSINVGGGEGDVTDVHISGCHPETVDIRSDTDGVIVTGNFIDDSISDDGSNVEIYNNFIDGLFVEDGIA